MDAKDDAELAKLRAAYEESRKKMERSAVFLLPFLGGVERWRENLRGVIQMGLVVYLNKPLLLLVPEHRVLEIPDGMRRLAAHIEVYKDNDVVDMTRATEALMEWAQKEGILPP